MRALRTYFFVIAVASAVAVPEVIDAQAYCALRDPVQTIYELYPSATSYKSIVATVDDTARASISARYGLTMHHGELGRHTLYVALRNGSAIGLVHVRSERTQWGLAEVVWALDLDLRVVDFRLQRSRSTGRAALESESFRSTLRGKTGNELAVMLTPGGNASSLAPRGAGIDQTLAVAIVTSGAKAIAASEAVWGPDIERFKRSVRP